MKSRILPTLLITLMLAMPVSASAQTLDTSSQIIALLTQIITLQKTLIENLQNQLTQLQNQIATLAPPVANLLSTQHNCTIVQPPTCATVLSVTYDSYNCVTGYQCAPAAMTITQPVQPTLQSTGGSCVAYNTIYANGSTKWCSVKPGAGIVCPLGLGFSPWTCSNGQWVTQ